MNGNTAVAKAGSLLRVTEGCYSDYQVTGFFVVLKEFSPEAELAEFCASDPRQLEMYHFSGDKYLATLLAKGLLLEIQHGELHLTDYSSTREFSFTPTADGR